jgi:hypothetical protein
MAISAELDCRATAALLRSGSSVALAGHLAAVMSVFTVAAGGVAAWIATSAIAVWCVVIYLAIRVNIDAGLLELLADKPAEELDEWFNATGIRKNIPHRTIAERRNGAVRLWKRLMAAVAVQIALLMLALLWRFTGFHA